MALAFSGITQTESIASAIVPAFPWSMACWYNPSTISSTQIIMSQSVTATSFKECGMLNVSGKLQTFIGNTGGSTNVQSVSSMSTATWFHCGSVFTSGTLFVYLNGVQASVANARTLSSLNTTNFAAWYDPGISYFAASGIALAAHWNIGLSATDFLALAAGANPRKVQPSHLVSVNLLNGFSPEPDIVLSSGWTVTGSPTVVPNPRFFL